MLLPPSILPIPPPILPPYHTTCSFDGGGWGCVINRWLHAACKIVPRLEYSFPARTGYHTKILLYIFWYFCVGAGSKTRLWDLLLEGAVFLVEAIK